jgi:putative uncharacterized protein (fragment)
MLSYSLKREDLHSLISQVVVTPFNFISYNIYSSNLEKHGLHSRFLNLTVNVPLTFGVLGLMAYVHVIGLILRKKKRPSMVRLMFLMTFVVSLMILSIIPHQEPRFLIPSLFVLSYLYGSRLKSNKLLLTFWIIFNLVLTIFYGYIHQAGVTRSLFWLEKQNRQQASNLINIIVSRTYLPPQYLLHIAKNDSRVTIHDLSIDKFPESVELTLKNLINTSKSVSSDQRSIYLILPSCLSHSLIKLGSKLSLSNFELVKQFFPHFTGEDLDWSSFQLNLSSLKAQFSLNVYQIVV